MTDIVVIITDIVIINYSVFNTDIVIIADIVIITDAVIIADIFIIPGVVIITNTDIVTDISRGPRVAPGSILTKYQPFRPVRPFGTSSRSG